GGRRPRARPVRPARPSARDLPRRAADLQEGRGRPDRSARTRERRGRPRLVPAPAFPAPSRLAYRRQSQPGAVEAVDPQRGEHRRAILGGPRRQAAPFPPAEPERPPPAARGPLVTDERLAGAGPRVPEQLLGVDGPPRRRAGG